MSTFDPVMMRKAVAEFTPRRPEKFHNLIPAKEVISELRQKRASYWAIAKLLTKHCLPTSKTAVASFCHRVLGENVRPYHRSRAPRTRANGADSESTQAHEPKPPAPPTPEASDDIQGPPAHTRGPRIAKVRLLNQEEGK